MYINVYHREEGPFPGKKIAISAKIRGKTAEEMSTIKMIDKRIKKGKLDIELCERVVIFKSGPKEWRFGLDFDSEVEAMENLLQKDFKMTTSCFSENGILRIAFEY